MSSNILTEDDPDNLNSGAIKRAQNEGFFDLAQAPACVHPSHNYPSGLYVAPGKGYTHKCPGCGYVTTVTNPQIY